MERTFPSPSTPPFFKPIGEGQKGSGHCCDCIVMCLFDGHFDCAVFVLNSWDLFILFFFFLIVRPFCSVWRGLTNHCNS